MNLTDHYKEQEKTIRERWFKNHKAVFEEHGPIKMLTWHEEKNSCYWCRYIIHGPYLMVYGDIGEAIYGWGRIDGGLTWEWIAGLSFDYFAGKCCASETGRKFLFWHSRIAANRIKEELSDPIMIKDWLEDAVAHCSFETEWQMWLHKNGADAFGMDRYCELGDIGQVINIRCQGHLIGIQMALEKANS